MPLIRLAVTTAVETTARALSLAGSALTTVSRLLHPDPREGEQHQDSSHIDLTVDPSTTAAPRVVDEARDAVPDARVGRVAGPAPTPLLDTEPHQRRAETHISELANNTATDVIREIDHLSTDELGQLFEYESAHRNRKTVLAAIERALAPAASSR